MRFPNEERPTALAMLVAVIAHSQIVVAERGRPALDLPEGFDETDIAVLDWIAAHARRWSRNLSRNSTLM